MLKKSLSLVTRKIDEDVNILMDLKNGNCITVNDELFEIVNKIDNVDELQIQKEIEICSDDEIAKNTIAFLLQNNVIINNFVESFDKKIVTDNEYVELVLCLNEEPDMDSSKIIEQCKKILSKKTVKKVIINTKYSTYKRHVVDILNTIYSDCISVSLCLTFQDFLAIYNEKDQYLDCFSELYIAGCVDTQKIIVLQDENKIRKNIYEKIIIRPSINSQNYKTIHEYIIDLLFLGIRFKFDPISYFHYINLADTKDLLTSKEILIMYWNILSSLEQSKIYQVPDELLKWLDRIPYKYCGAGINQILISAEGDLYGCYREYNEKSIRSFECKKNKCMSCSIFELCGLKCIFRDEECLEVKFLIEEQLKNWTDSSTVLLERIKKLL